MPTTRFVLISTTCLLTASAQAQTVTLASAHPQENGGFGTTLASVPDTDGDGIADVVVGAFNQNVGVIQSAGRVTIHSGATGALLKVLVSPNKEAYGWFGGSVAGVPDVTGDGRGDVLIGAYNEINTGTPESGAGRVYLFNGATGKWVRTITSPNAQAGGGFGRSVAGLGDITGDGKGDLAIGAYREDPNAAPDHAGRAYVFNGASGALLKTLVSNHQTTNGLFGTSLAAVPDATGDGKPDVAVGAIGESANGIERAGRAHLCNPVTGLIVKTLIPGKPEVAGGFGASVGGVSDTNGDGKGDVIVGAPFENAGVVESAGRAYLFSGSTGLVLRSFGLGVPESGDLLGAGVAGIPDINGDGKGDVLIGAPHADPGAAPADSGRAYIYSARNGAFIKSIGSPTPQAGGAFGTSVAGLPDTNNNGKGEAVAGAPLENTPTIDDVGRAYIAKN